MFIKMIGNYLQFFRNSTEPDTSKNIFNFSAYLDSIDSSRLPFMRDLIKTQNFASFVEKTYKCAEERNEMSFFIQGVRLQETKGEKALESEIKKVSDRLVYNYKNVLFPISHKIAFIGSFRELL